MSSAAFDLSLAAEFPATTEADWRKLVDGVLKGAPFDKLVGKTADGIAIAPIYRRAEGAAAVAGRGASPWLVAQRIDHPDAVQANAQALHDLENGATALALVFAGAPAAHGFGLPTGEAEIARALDGVIADAIGLSLDAADAFVAHRVAAAVLAMKADPAACAIRFGLDPIGIAAVGGARADMAMLAADVAALRKHGFAAPMVKADGRIVHDAGGSEAQELAFVLACGVAALRALDAGGIAPEDACGLIEARLSADADQFLTMAKCRALRRLWARVQQSCGVAPKPLFVAADTAWRMLTQRDSGVNMLRATVATFAAGIAGADAITVLPHTLALGLPDPFARRVARNTQLVLLEESNLARVADPAAGAGGIEALTSELCATAWTKFQAIERAGGIAVALASGDIARDIATVRSARDAAIARRKTVLTGASEFPNLQETAPAVLAPAPAAAPASANALAPTRLAAPFEALRDRSDAILARTGTRPTVVLARLGTPADYTARATFARSFFEAGGIAAVERDVADAAPQDAALVCLCSSDKVYADTAEAAATALRAAGAKNVYLAGKPGDLEAALRAAGVGDFIVAGGDALATLRAAYDSMETA